MAEPGEALAAIGMLPDVEIDPAPAALQLARLDASGPDWQQATEHLSVLARDAAAVGAVMSGRSQEARIGALAGLLHAHHGYRGDVEHYDDLDNANLIRVIERRRGLPVALGVLWLHCIRAAGWEGHGIDFPGHFMVALIAAPERVDSRRVPGIDGDTDRSRHTRQPKRMLIDPFGNGASIGSVQLLAMLQRGGADDIPLTPGMTRPMATRDVLLRLQRNLVQRRLLAGELKAALRSLEGMLLIAPDVMANWLDAAELNHGIGRMLEARRCLEQVLTKAPSSDAARHAQARLDAWTRPES
ncbi:transglutaminase family protein [Lichenicola sp.]|uniref:transglutaminase family protein n=1 Tax=Lichenicola sp. TaxID=2804529 RepID=UPI003B00B701